MAHVSQELTMGIWTERQGFQRHERLLISRSVILCKNLGLWLRN